MRLGPSTVWSVQRTFLLQLRFLSAGLLICLCLALAPAPSQSAESTGSDWPQFLGPSADGHSPETGLLERWPQDGPPRLWSKRIGTGYSAPSVKGNLLVLHHRVGNEEIVEAFQTADGAPVWRHAYPSRYRDPYGYNNGPRCTPLLTENRCYTYGAEGKLVCLNLADGKLVWQRDTQKDFQVPEAFFGVGSSPILEDGLLIVMVGGQPNAGVVAFDAETGKTVWESVGRDNWDGLPKIGWRGEPPVRWQESMKQASYATPVAATIHGQRHLLCFMRQGLVSLDPKTGRVHFSYWFRSTVNESVNAANPVVQGDTILVSGAYYHVGAVLLRVQPDGRGVKEVWRDTVLEIHWTTPVLRDGHVYAFSGRNEPDARFRCVEMATGKLKWDIDQSWAKYSTKQPERYGRGSAIVADGKLIVLGEGGRLGLFEASPERAEEISSFQVPEMHHPCWAAPVLSRGQLYLRSEDFLVCYGLGRNP